MRPKYELDFLMANISHLHHRCAHQRLEALELYRGQPPVLHILWEQEGLTQTEIAGKLRIKPATMTRMLQRMEKAGFIYRRIDPDDQRITRVFLTEKGRAVQNRLENIWKSMEEDTFKNFTPEELALLKGFLLRIRDNLAQAAGEAPWE